MRKHAATILLCMLVFAGFGSTGLVSRSLAGSKPPTLIQREKQLGPKPTPHWYWRWLHWRVTRVGVKGQASQRRFRPKEAPRRIPTWAWRRLRFFLIARRPAGDSGAQGASTGGRSYEQAISYTRTRPTFTPRRTVEVSNASELQSAIANLRPGDLVEATASFSVSGETTISSRLSAPAVIDLSQHVVRFVYSGGSNTPAVWLNNPQNIRIYGGDLSTDGSGGACIYSSGMQDVLWWGFNAHDCGGTGLVLIPNTQPITGNDLQGEISHAGLNLAWDPHAEKGTGLHGAYLGNGAYAFSGNRLALFVHDQPSGAAIQYGAGSGKTAPAGNVIYERAVNLTEVATQQTGGNGIQFWGIAGQSADIKYLEVDNAQGYGLFGGGMYSGTTLSGVKVEYGLAANTNRNPRLSEPGNPGPWDRRGGVVYQTVQPTR